ncbi:MAG: YqhA family protein, partial [Roseibium sp.]
MTEDAKKTDTKQVMDPVTRLTRASQIPLLIGMAIGLILFLITYFVYIFEAVQTFEFLDRKKTILLMLNLLDMVFIANLVIMIATNTY